MAYTVVNLYVWMLCLLNWPVKVYFREYEVDEEKEPAVQQRDADRDFDALEERKPATNSLGHEIEMQMRPGNVEEEKKEDE